MTTLVFWRIQCDLLLSLNFYQLLECFMVGMWHFYKCNKIRIQIITLAPGLRRHHGEVDLLDSCPINSCRAGSFHLVSVTTCSAADHAPRIALHALNSVLFS